MTHIPLVHINTLFEAIDASEPLLKNQKTNFTVMDMDEVTIIQVSRTVTYDRYGDLIDHVITFNPEVEIVSEYPMQSIAARDVNPKTWAECEDMNLIIELESDWLRLSDILSWAIEKLHSIGEITEELGLQQTRNLIDAVADMRGKMNTQEDYDRIMKCFDYDQYSEILMKGIKSNFNNCCAYKTLLSKYGIELTEDVIRQ